MNRTHLGRAAGGSWGRRRRRGRWAVDRCRGPTGRSRVVVGGRGSERIRGLAVGCCSIGLGHGLGAIEFLVLGVAKVGGIRGRERDVLVGEGNRRIAVVGDRSCSL